MWPLVCTLVCLGATVFAQPNDYHGYKTYNLTLDTQDKIEYFKRYDGLVGYDIWLWHNPRKFAVVMVEPRHQKNFELTLKKKFIHYKILHNDVGEVIKEEARQHRPNVAFRSFTEIEEPTTDYAFDHFPRYQQIVEFLNSLQRNRTYSKVIEIGKSYEGKPILGIEVMRDPSNPFFLIDGGMHAREWASPVGAMRIARNVVENESTFASTMNLVIIPCLNPDGYEYTHTDNRLWRKNRSVQPGTDCSGVDLNRNFDSHWGEFRSEKNPCMGTYGGTGPFTEPESRALRDTILKYKPVAYLTLHSFGSYILYPWGFSKSSPPNEEILHDIAKEIAAKLKDKYGSVYKIGSAAQVLYEASGASDDWAMEKGNVPIVFTMELPAYSDRIFVVPEDKIPEAANEAFVAFVVMFNNVYKAITRSLGTVYGPPPRCCNNNTSMP